MIGINHYLILSALMFSIGLYGIIRRKNFLMLLFTTEIMLSALSVALAAISHYTYNVEGQVFVLFVIALAASEVAIGLGLMILWYKKYKNLDIDFLAVMKG